MARAELYHMIGEQLVFFSLLYIKLFELGVEVNFNNKSTVTTKNLIGSNSHFGEAALSTRMMLFGCGEGTMMMIAFITINSGLVPLIEETTEVTICIMFSQKTGVLLAGILTSLYSSGSESHETRQSTRSQ